ncbi:MAG: transcription termination/antitermination protein NusG [Desulfovibrionaceae bacterium]
MFHQNEIQGGARWYVAQTRPRAEARASEHLRNQGYEAWLPAYWKTRRHARRVDTVRAPLFPGYVFVRLDLQHQAWTPIQSTWGVTRMLCQQGAPAPLPDGFASALLDAADDTGCVVLREAELARGQRLRVTAGAYREYIGTLLDLPGRDRVAILLQAFGREVTATLPRKFVIPA